MIAPIKDACELEKVKKKNQSFIFKSSRENNISLCKHLCLLQHDRHTNGHESFNEQMRMNPRNLHKKTSILDSTREIHVSSTPLVTDKRIFRIIQKLATKQIVKVKSFCLSECTFLTFQGIYKCIHFSRKGLNEYKILRI